MCNDQTRLFSVENSVTKLMGYSLTSMLKHDSTFSNEMDERGTLPLNTVLDNLGSRVNPISQYVDGRIFASFVNGSVNQKFFIDIYLHDKWNPEQTSMVWSIYIGCNPDHSTSVVIPPRVTHKLTITECQSLGWTFHVTDKQFQRSIFSDGLILRVKCENNGSPGYITNQKGSRNKSPKRVFNNNLSCVEYSQIIS